VLKELESLTNKEFSVGNVGPDAKMGVKVWAGIKRVTEIGLAECGLTTLPESIGALKSLKRLNILGNKLKTLPKSIKKLKERRVAIMYDYNLKKMYLEL
jgi:Leucine-rich repeat (LRR) protein